MCIHPYHTQVAAQNRKGYKSWLGPHAVQKNELCQRVTMKVNWNKFKSTCGMLSIYCRCNTSRHCKEANSKWRPTLIVQTVYSFITPIAQIPNLSYSHSYKTLHTKYLQWGKLVPHDLNAAAWKCLCNSFKQHQ